MALLELSLYKNDVISRLHTIKCSFCLDLLCAGKEDCKNTSKSHASCVMFLAESFQMFHFSVILAIFADK